jgi:hypothetical protein
VSPRGGFSRSLRFALLCAAACGLWIAFAAPLLGRSFAVESAFALAAAAYLIGIAPRRATGMTAATLLLGASAALMLAGVRVSTFAGALAVGIGALRSAWLWPVSPGDAAAFARRFLAELALLGGGLLFAVKLGQAGVFPEALALWGFLLVQSAFFVLEGAAAPAVRAEPIAVDPFEGSCRRLRAVLEERN